MSGHAGSERPCRVKLKVFSFDSTRLRSTMAGAVPQIIIPDAVLCSEMGVHFSPCGRYLAACIACHVRSGVRLPSVDTRPRGSCYSVPHRASFVVGWQLQSPPGQAAGCAADAWNAEQSSEHVQMSMMILQPLCVMPPSMH